VVRRGEKKNEAVGVEGPGLVTVALIFRDFRLAGGWIGDSCVEFLGFVVGGGAFGRRVVTDRPIFWVWYLAVGVSLKKRSHFGR
jgi:hypothetical protein